MNEEPLLHSVSDIRGAVRIEIVFELQQVPHIAAVRVRPIGCPNRPIESWLDIPAVPQPVLPGEVPGAPLLYFPAHHMNSPFFQSMQCHYVWRIVLRSIPAAAQPVGKAYRRVNVHNRKLTAVQRDMPPETQGKNELDETR